MRQHYGNVQFLEHPPKGVKQKSFFAYFVGILTSSPGEPPDLEISTRCMKTIREGTFGGSAKANVFPPHPSSGKRTMAASLKSLDHGNW